KYARPAVEPFRCTSGGFPKSRQFFSAKIFDCISQRIRAVLLRPRLLVVANNAIHVTPANSYNRCAARLTLQRHKSKRFLNAWMNEKISGAVVTSEIRTARAVRKPRNVPDAPLQFLHFVPQRPVTNYQQVKFVLAPLLQQLECSEQCFCVFFSGQSPRVEKQCLFAADA